MKNTHSKVYIVLVLLLSGLFTTIHTNVYTFSTGSPFGYTGAPYEFTCADGIGCHNGSIYTDGIIVTVTDQDGYEVDTFEPLGTYNVEIRAVGYASTCYGFQTLVLGDESTNSEGLLTPGPGDMEYGMVGFREYLRHTAPSPTGVWNYTWTASNFIDQDVTIYTSINVSNCNYLSSGDTILTNITKLEHTELNCDIEWELMQAQPGILFFDCEFGIPDTPRLEVAITNFSGGSGNYDISSPGAEFSQTTAVPGDTVYVWFTQEQLDADMVTILVNDETSVCEPYDSINIALNGFPIAAICTEIEDECALEIAFDGDSDGILDINDFYCENNLLTLSGTIDGPHVGYYLDLFQGYPGWLSMPGSFDISFDPSTVPENENISLDILLGETGMLCQSYNLDSILSSIDLEQYCAGCNVSFNNELDSNTDVECYDDGTEYSIAFSVNGFEGNSPLYFLSLSSGTLSEDILGSQSGNTESIITLNQGDIDAGDVILTITNNDSEICYQENIISSLEAVYLTGINVDEICNPNSSVDDLEQADIIVYPNPASAGSEIRFKNQNVSEVELIDMQGRSIDSQVLENNAYHLNDDLAEGIYILKAKVGQSISTTKLKVIGAN